MVQKNTLENVKQQPKFALEPDQEKAIEDLGDWWNSSTEEDVVLIGPPGSGKTFLAKFFANTLPECVPLFTAPTNEAVRQLELSLQGTAPTKTTYSALGLKLSTHSFKQKIYQSALPEDFNNFNLLAVDESSMVGKKNPADKKASDLLMDYVLQSGIRRIWLGDWAQLPPVESSAGESPIFKEGFRTIELDSVKRHAGAILEFAMQIRGILKQPTRNLPRNIDPEIRQLVRGAEGMLELSLEDYQAVVEDRGRILTWTNGITKYSKVPGVQEYNFKIRSRLFGVDRALESDIWPTDRILFASPLFEVEERGNVKLQEVHKAEFKILASVNARGEVLRAEKVFQFGIECWKTELEMEGGVNAIAYIPTKAGEERKKEMEKEFCKTALEAESSKEAAQLWHYYHCFRQMFADVKHTYCITTHRAQGSTIPSVIVDVGNILQNRDRLIAFKSLYVALTRAADKLAIVK